MSRTRMEPTDATPPGACEEPLEETEGGLPSIADRDLALLARPDLRGVRLQLEYLKAELALAERGVRGTIVVFGSTRLVEPEVARERLAQAERHHREAPGDPGARAELEGAQRALALSRYSAEARELGRLVGRASQAQGDGGLAIVTGGGPGAMEAANRGAHEIGADSVGLNVVLPRPQPPNPYLSPGLCFHFRYFALRKLHFLLRARALVAFPGGYGTLDEVFETLCLIQTGKHEGMPVVLVGESFWRRAIDFDFLLEQGMIGSKDREIFTFADTASEAWTRILDWYARNGRSIFS